jgi:hypothetical protein
VTRTAPGLALHVSGTMRRDDHPLSAGGVGGFKLAVAHAQGFEMRIHEWIMHELAEDGHRFALGSFMRGAEGVANAEAHAVMLSEMEFHRRICLRLMAMVGGCLQWLK